MLWVHPFDELIEELALHGHLADLCSETLDLLGGTILFDLWSGLEGLLSTLEEGLVPLGQLGRRDFQLARECVERLASEDS